MAFVKREDILENSQKFVADIDNGTYKKNSLTNHSTVFKGAREALALSSFRQFISSASYALIRLRRGRYLGDEYHGC